MRGSLRGLLPALALFALAALVVAGLPFRCPLLAITGVPCPTCGLTRATRLALHGQLADATRMHPLWFVVVPACVALGAGEMTAYWRSGQWGKLLERRGVQRLLVAIGLALVVVWVARLARGA
jgi:hypothetical protein